MEIEILDTGFYELNHEIVYPHQHETEFELMLFKNNGRCFVQEHVEYDKIKDRIFLLCPGEQHEVKHLPGVQPDSAVHLTMHWVTFSVSDATIEQSLRSSFGGAGKTASSKTYKILNDIYVKYLSKNDLLLKSMHHQFLSMLFELFNDSDDLGDPSESDSRILEAIRIMKSKLYENLDLNDLSATLDLNKNYFFVLFKKKIGESPMHYFTDMKLVEASKWLINTDIKLSEIPPLLKFYNLSHFSRLFKKKYGKSPLQFRK